MLSVNLREELESSAQGVGYALDSLQDDELATTLLAGLGIETVREQEQRLQRRKALMQGVYTEQQVHKLCIKYRLRCLPVDLFKGDIDEAVPRKKREFEREFEEVMQQGVYQADYRIVAPSELFDLKLAQLDPLLMYQFKIDDTYYYKLVHQWGGDLSPWRSIVNYPLRSMKHLIGCSLVFWCTLIAALVLLTGSMSVAGGGMVMGLLITFCIVIGMLDSNGQCKTSDQIWTSERL